MKEELARLKVASFHVKENSDFAILSLLVSWAIMTSDRSHDEKVTADDTAKPLTNCPIRFAFLIN